MPVVALCVPRTAIRGRPARGVRMPDATPLGQLGDRGEVLGPVPAGVGSRMRPHSGQRMPCDLGLPRPYSPRGIAHKSVPVALGGPEHARQAEWRAGWGVLDLTPELTPIRVTPRVLQDHREPTGRRHRDHRVAPSRTGAHRIPTSFVPQAPRRPMPPGPPLMKALANFPSGWTDAGACARNALAASRSVVLVLRRLQAGWARVVQRVSTAGRDRDVVVQLHLHVACR